MSLEMKDYTPPFSSTPVPAAYAWIVDLHLNFQGATGSLNVGINYSAADAAAGLPTIATVPIRLGQPIAPGVTFPTLVELLTAAAAAQQANPALDPFGAIREALYRSLLTLPAFAGATEVP